MSCLSDENLAALVDGSASAEQADEWNRHVDECDSCAVRLLREQRRRTGSPAVAVAADGDGGTDPDATVTVKPVGKPILDAKAEHPPTDAIPGYRIHKRENELRHDGYPFFMVLPA